MTELASLLAYTNNYIYEEIKVFQILFLDSPQNILAIQVQFIWSDICLKTHTYGPGSISPVKFVSEFYYTWYMSIGLTSADLVGLTWHRANMTSTSRVLSNMA